MVIRELYVNIEIRSTTWYLYKYDYTSNATRNHDQSCYETPINVSYQPYYYKITLYNDDSDAALCIIFINIIVNNNNNNNHHHDTPAAAFNSSIIQIVAGYVNNTFQ